MSLESFFGLEDSESSGSAESSEKFREQMRKNSKAIKAMNAHQKKQKKKEDKLAKLLVRFIQDRSKGDMVFLVVKLLQENVPGAFILAVLSLADPELEKELHESLKALTAPSEDEALTEAAPTAKPITQNDKLPQIISLPQNLRDDLNAWGDAILKAGALMPGKTLKSVLTPENKLKSIVLDVIDYSLEAYFDRHGLKITDQNIRQFALISIQSILIQLRELHQSKPDEAWIEGDLT